MAIQVNFVSLSGAAVLTAFLISKNSPWSLLYSLAVVFGIFIPTYTFYLSYIFPFYISELRHVPTVPGFPLWGQFFEIITNECGVPQRKWHQEQGPIIRYFFPFGAERLAVADDDAIKQVNPNRNTIPKVSQALIQR